ncbi:MAG: recombinase family protein [Selenomonadaceae bacterium]|nr:recombinase family protein [Selenomonadaceae bacterium]
MTEGFLLKFAYARVSTRKQFRDGNGLEEQIAKLENVGFDELVVEEFSGATTKRPQLDALIQRLQTGDTLIVTKLDRFARSAAEGLSLINSLLARGVHVFILNMGLIDNTPIGKLITTILLAIAEFERDMIVERTQAGKEIARTKHGFRDGRPPIDQKKKDFAADLILNQHKSYNEVVELTGLSKSTLTRAVRHAKANLILAEKNAGN